jgi:hypothetical protein
MSAPELDLYIERLVLEKLSPSERERVATALVAELERLVAEQGLPPDLVAAGSINLPHHGVTVAAGSRPDAIGVQVAQSLYHSLSGGTAPAESGAHKGSAGVSSAQRGS